MRWTGRHCSIKRRGGSSVTQYIETKDKAGAVAGAGAGAGGAAPEPELLEESRTGPWRECQSWSDSARGQRRSAGQQWLRGGAGAGASGGQR